jgi:iron complex outermembrane receptor protein
MRGIRMYVDGIPAIISDGQVQTPKIDLTRVGRVEVRRGPFSALYGNTSGCVINIKAQTGQQLPTIEASSYYGSYGMKVIAAMGGGFLEAMWITRFQPPALRPQRRAEKTG